MKSLFSFELAPLNLEGAAPIKSGDRVAMNTTLLEGLKQLSSEKLNAHLDEVEVGMLKIAENTESIGKNRRVLTTGFYLGVFVKWMEIDISQPGATTLTEVLGSTGAFITQELLDHLKNANSPAYEWEFVL